MGRILSSMHDVKWVGWILVGIGIGVVGTLGIMWSRPGKEVLSPLVNLPALPREKPYEAFTFASLSARTYSLSKIEIGDVIQETSTFTSRLFTYTSDGKQISGQITFPAAKPDTTIYPVIVMARGYVDKESYKTGV